MARKKPTPPPPPRPPGVGPREMKFVEEYLLTGKAVRSYMAAYPGTTYGSAATLASRLLKKVHIRAELEAARLDQRRHYRVTAGKVIRKWAELAFSDIGDVMDLTNPAYPRLKKYADMPAEARRAVQSIARTRDGVRVKLADQAAALKALSAHLGIAQEIAPLDALLAALPPELAARVRAALANPTGEMT